MVSDKSVTHQPGALAVSIRFEVRGGFRHDIDTIAEEAIMFQSALRFAVVSDYCTNRKRDILSRVSIRFEVRGGFRPPDYGYSDFYHEFQSALRFAVVSDAGTAECKGCCPNRFNPL